MSYTVKLDLYEGPIGVLLTLIQGADIDIYQLSITDLVADFMAEIELRKRLDLEIATEFLLVAATLIEIKCRKLFPSSSLLDDDEELAFFEERDLLLARLLEAKTYRDVSSVFGTLIELGAARFGREVGFGVELSHLVPDPLSNLDPIELANAYDKALRASTPESLSTHHVTPLPRMSVLEAREILLSRLVETKSNSFEVVTTLASTKIEVVLYFLGLLELYKLGLIRASQGEFGGILIEVIDDTDKQGSPN
ncbi:MAG: ScpA family protein [Actinomycetota bacterium]|nr:ScpA family protein [Actinomycetota bacterium]